MTHNPVIAALGAFGAWLLVAGPLYQAAMELRDQGASERRELPEGVVPPQRISPWWWLLPPVAYWKYRQERERVKSAVLQSLSAEDVQRILTFSNTALGWLLVAGGATCIAIKETWEFVEAMEWPWGWTLLLVVLAGMAALGNTSYQTARTSRILARFTAADTP
ncbi:hypothetical protein [Nocardia macrotermitis]|uniref:Uncharacterized protein n=1 Tax=Nocardia macrotermitis TaxID=2585198 RepID=A0A7K0DEJ5_9NOCA|nr:hypothetical protein [Nocardia macrotermitis]MQY23931.1 hypothetical protein [Nocardia macrotermitis]